MTNDELTLLKLAARSCRFHLRSTRIEDLAKFAGLRDYQIDPILSDWKQSGWWDYAVTPRAGYVTRAGVEIAFPSAQLVAAA